VDELPSLLGHYFRMALHNGTDAYPYTESFKADGQAKLKLWQDCRNNYGIHLVPESYNERQQYIPIE
jgi:hypothetical protein